MLLAFALDAFGIRSTSGVDSRPSGLISVHSTFESHDRPHRTCWPPHLQGAVEARSQPHAECTQKMMRSTTLPCQCHPAAPPAGRCRGSRCSCALVDLMLLLRAPDLASHERSDQQPCPSPAILLCPNRNSNLRGQQARVRYS